MFFLFIEKSFFKKILGVDESEVMFTDKIDI